MRKIAVLTSGGDAPGRRVIRRVANRQSRLQLISTRRT